MIDTQAIRKRWETVGSKLDERGRRVFAAGEARAAGWGGLDAVFEITGIARSTIGRGLKDLDAAPLPKGRVRRNGEPQRVDTHDFPDKKKGKAVPYGVLDITANVGWVSVGITHDTAEFAVASIRTWLERMGRQRYPNMRELVPDCDPGSPRTAAARTAPACGCGRSSCRSSPTRRACRSRSATIRRAPRSGTRLVLAQAGIEHRLFCHITQNWRAKPLADRAAVVELIAATTTKTGLKVECELDTRTYQKGIKVSDAEMRSLDIRGDKFHPEWNYTIHPRPAPNRSG